MLKPFQRSLTPEMSKARCAMISCELIDVVIKTLVKTYGTFMENIMIKFVIYLLFKTKIIFAIDKIFALNCKFSVGRYRKDKKKEIF